MNYHDPHPNGLLIISDLIKRGVDDRALRRADDLVRVRRGVYSSSAPSLLKRDARYDLRIAAVLATRRRDAIVSHYSAARAWGLPIVNDWPSTVHVTELPGGHRRSKNGVFVHRSPLAEGDIVDVGGEFRATSLARTLVDLARAAPMRDAVAAIDHALFHDLVAKDELYRVLHELGQINGRRVARDAIDFSTALANRPGESYSRVMMFELGFPVPQLQKEFWTVSGRRAGDFWWQKWRLMGEFDGYTKYFDPAMTKGRTPQEVLRDQKARERELRQLGIRFARWDWADLDRVTPFVAELEAAGLRRIRKPAVVPTPDRSARSTGRNVPERAH